MDWNGRDMYRVANNSEYLNNSNASYLCLVYIFDYYISERCGFCPFIEIDKTSWCHHWNDFGLDSTGFVALYIGSIHANPSDNLKPIDLTKNPIENPSSPIGRFRTQ